MPGYKSRLFRVGLSALRKTGIARALGPWTAGKGAILMMHRVQPASLHGAFRPNASLSITPEYLDALLTGFRAAAVDVVTLDEALQRLAAPGSTRRFVCFTFDDGYRDNHDHALPVFRRHGAPFTVYPTSGFVERRFAPWWYVLETVIATHELVRFCDDGVETLHDTSNLAAKHRVYGALSRAFLRSRQAEVHAKLQHLADDHGLSLPEFTAREICGYDELRALRAGGAEIGCHSVTHSLFLHEAAADVRRELEDSRRALELELGVPVNHLAYPYGARDHVGERDLRIAAELGFASATTTRKGTLFPVHAQHRHALPRIEVTPTFSDSAEYLQTIVSGLPLILRNRGRRAIID